MPTSAPAITQAGATAQPANVAAAQAAAVASAQRTANSDYMRRAVRKWVNIPLQGGAQTGTFALGANLNFTVPPVNNGWLEALDITVNLNLTYTAAGSGPFGNLTAGAPWNVIKEIDVLLNGQILRLYPAFMPYVRQMRGYLRNAPGQVLAGDSATDIAAQIYIAPAIATGVNKNWLFKLRIPFNMLHPYDGAGLLPIAGEANPVQVVVTCAPALYANPGDPLFVPVNTNGTVALTASSTQSVKVDGVYRDGTTLWSPAKIPYYPEGLPSVQWNQDVPLTPFTATNQTVRGQIKTMLQHYYMLSIVIDGQSTTNYSLYSNFNGIELDTDATGTNKLAAYGAASTANIQMDAYWNEIRETYGQDLASQPQVEGMIPWVDARARGVADASNQDGMMALNMTPGGYTTIYHGYNMAAIGGTAGITPRVETLVISANPAGLAAGS